MLLDPELRGSLLTANKVMMVDGGRACGSARSTGSASILLRGQWQGRGGRGWRGGIVARSGVVITAVMPEVEVEIVRVLGTR